MAVVARIDDIVVKMYVESLFPPHFVAVKGEEVGVFDLHSLEALDSDLSKEAEDKVVNWASVNRDHLLKAWRKGVVISPLEMARK